MKIMKKMLKNKKGLQFRNAFFAILIVGMVVAAVGVIIGEWSAYYHSGISWNLGNFNQGDSVSTTAEEFENSVTPTTPEIGSDYQSNIFQSVYGVITNIFSPFAVVFGTGGMLDSIASLVHIPSYIIKTIVTMMVLSIVFALIAIIFRQFRTTT